MGERASGFCSRTPFVVVFLCLNLLLFVGCQAVSRVPADRAVMEPDTDPPVESTSPPQPEDVTADEGGAETPPELGPAEPDGAQAEPAAPGDLNGDGVVGDDDFDIFVAAFDTEEGDQGFDPRLDFDGDGQITFVDQQIWNDLAFGTQP